MLLLKAIERCVQSMPRADVSAETSEVQPTLAARRADALSVIAESFLAHGAEPLSGGDRHQIVVHVEATTLEARGAGSCGLEDGPAIPAETARRLACDASVIRILEDTQGKPLDVGRKTSTIPPAIRRALKARDQGCRFPGCSNTRYVDGHHIHHWAKGGETKLANLVSLCRFHHRSVHEGGFSVQVLDDGAVRFKKPNGQASPVHRGARLLSDHFLDRRPTIQPSFIHTLLQRRSALRFGLHSFYQRHRSHSSGSDAHESMASRSIHPRVVATIHIAGFVR